MKGTTIHLSDTWILGDRIGGGGFGAVYAASSGGRECAAKLIRKLPGTDRELLFVDLGGIRNVIPIIDSGEHEDFLVLVMPRAEKSLREHMNAADDHLPLPEVIDVLMNICDALVDLEGSVVHRDIKPENVLSLDGVWCLADFGISRYAEATTEQHTHKHALTPQYAAPERWRSERATAAADVYSLGVMAYEMISGALPFEGSEINDFRDQHLHGEAPPLQDVPPALAALVEECLYKSPAARPTPPNLRARLDRSPERLASSGLAQLAEVNREESRRHAEALRRASERQTASERFSELIAAARASHDRISLEVLAAISAVAPAAQQMPQSRGWRLLFGRATLEISPATDWDPRQSWGTAANSPAFTVVSLGGIAVTTDADRDGYTGRSHSLWYCNAQDTADFGWFETAFMISPLLASRSQIDPFALPPNKQSAEALSLVIGSHQVAWPFTRLETGGLDEFVDRWSGWFAQAAIGELRHPTHMPERSADGSWRRH